jgi:hypothetical protein
VWNASSRTVAYRSGVSTMISLFAGSLFPVPL